MSAPRCRIEKLVFGGAGLARMDGKVVFVYGAFPDETVEIEYVRQQRDFLEARVLNVLEASPQRVAPIETHCFACSPWQELNYEAEKDWKRAITQETLKRQTTLCKEELTIAHDPRRLGYRNRLEYHFAQHDQQLWFALHEPSTQRAVPIEFCQLGLPALQQASLELLPLLREAHLRPAELQRLTLRGNRHGQVHAFLSLSPAAQQRLGRHQAHWPDTTFELFLLDLDKSLSPQTLPQTQLTESLSGHSVAFGGLGFFQVNPWMLDQLLTYLRPFVAGRDILDFYGGVGTLSCPFATDIHSCVIVESHPEACFFAERNVREWPRFEVQHSKAERALSLLGSSQTVIVNPPRAGLQAKVCKRLGEVQPESIIYLSCNVTTCARDLRVLQTHYDLVDQRIFNFFPATPHIELLTILKRRGGPVP